MTGYINLATGEIVEDYDEIVDTISALDGGDLQDYILTNYGDFFEMCVEIIKEGETKIGNSIYSDIGLLTADLYKEMKELRYEEWAYFDSKPNVLNMRVTTK